MLTVFFGIGIWYFHLDGYAGEVEPMISSVSWLLNNGEPLYHSIDSHTRYSVLYGPSVYLTNGLFLKLFGANLAATKLASFLAAVLSLGFLYGALAKRKIDSIAALGVVLAILYFWNQGFSIYLVRPDAFLVFSVSFSILVYRRARRWLAVVALGCAMGFAINLKIHSFLYFLPLLVLFHKKHGKKALEKCLLVAAISVLAPFLLHPQISLFNYSKWLFSALGHGLITETIQSTFGYGISLTLPLLTVSLLAPQRKNWFLSNITLTISLLVSFLGTLVLSAKPGAGMVHLLPLVPLFVFLAGTRARKLNHLHWTDCRTNEFQLFLGRTALTVLFVSLFVGGGVHAYRSSMLINWQNRQSFAVSQDILKIMSDFKGLSISMACGGENQFFHNTYVRPLLVFADHPLLIDPIAVMDCHKAGMELSKNTSLAIAQGAVSIWLVPRNQKPFQKQNWYAPHEEIFPEDFILCFHKNYSNRFQSEFFDLYFWNGLAREKVPSPELARLN
ncbi:MAG: hypothetical protein GY780_02855 [bacterium]|nr:hypothetical protein [bacterium]